MNIIGLNGSMSGTKTGIALKNLSFSDQVNYEQINLKDLEMSFADGRDFREYNNDNRVLIEKLIAADAIVIGTPVYQASFPGVLKNVFDLLPINALQDKTVGVVVTAGSARHYLMAQTQLFPILNYFKTNLVSKIVFIESQDFIGDTLRDDIAMRMETLSQTIETQVESKNSAKKALYSFL